MIQNRQGKDTGNSVKVHERSSCYPSDQIHRGPNDRRCRIRLIPEYGYDTAGGSIARKHLRTWLAAFVGGGIQLSQRCDRQWNQLPTFQSIGPTMLLSPTSRDHSTSRRGEREWLVGINN